MNVKSDKEWQLLSDKRTFKIVKDDKGKCTEIYVNDKLYWKFEYDKMGNLTKEEQFYYKKKIKSLDEVLKMEDFDGV